jgi:hypothetical protein
MAIGILGVSGSEYRTAPSFSKTLSEIRFIQPAGNDLHFQSE